MNEDVACLAQTHRRRRLSENHGTDEYKVEHNKPYMASPTNRPVIRGRTKSRGTFEAAIHDNIHETMMGSFCVDEYLLSGLGQYVCSRKDKTKIRRSSISCWRPNYSPFN